MLLTGYVSRSLVLTWDGRTWTQVTAPSPGLGTSLWDASCATADACVAVGQQEPSPDERAGVILEWDGTSLSTATPAVPGPGSDEIWGVSCPRPQTCVAVGDWRPNGQASDPARALVETDAR
jgi:hypothetical protein